MKKELLATAVALMLGLGVNAQEQKAARCRSAAGQ